jgi:hypothetical protein
MQKYASSHAVLNVPQSGEAVKVAIPHEHIQGGLIRQTTILRYPHRREQFCRFHDRQQR